MNGALQAGMAACAAGLSQKNIGVTSDAIRQPQLDSDISTLQGHIHRLHVNLHTLEDRLEPALESVNGAGAEGNQDFATAPSKYSNRLSMLSSQVDHANSLILSLVERLHV